MQCFKTFKSIEDNLPIIYPEIPMIKQVRMGVGEGSGGEFEFTETLKHFFVLKIPEILIGLKITITALFYCTSTICMSLHLKTLKNLVGEGAYSGM